MIKIQRLSAPAELTPAVVADKTAKYKADNKKLVWKEPYIESRLKEMSHDKCCYCECKLGEESKYMEVEHFHDKHDFPDEVVVWDNLLPSCKSCNGSKNDRNTVVEPIVNPSVDDPKNYLGFRDYAYKEKQPLGKETYEALHLNDIERLCVPRYRVCAELKKKVEDFLDRIQSVTPATHTRTKNNLKNDVVELLETCQEDREYTAIKATMMANNPDYTTLVNEMKKLGLWTPRHESLDSQMRVYVMDLL